MKISFIERATLWLYGVLNGTMFSFYLRPHSRLYWIRILNDAQQVANQFEQLDNSEIHSKHICSAFTSGNSAFEFQLFYGIGASMGFRRLLSEMSEENKIKWAENEDVDEVAEIRRLAICFFIAYVEDILENK